MSDETKVDAEKVEEAMVEAKGLDGMLAQMAAMREVATMSMETNQSRERASVALNVLSVMGQKEFRPEVEQELYEAALRVLTDFLGGPSE